MKKLTKNIGMLLLAIWLILYGFIESVGLNAVHAPTPALGAGIVLLLLTGIILFITKGILPSAIA